MAEATSNGKISRKGIGGPRTKRGKRRSSLNALKHGLNARRAAPRGEERAVFRAWRARLLKRWAPRSEAERLLARRFAEISWRLMRCGDEEVRIFEQAREGHEGPGGLARVFLETKSANALDVRRRMVWRSTILTTVPGFRALGLALCDRTVRRGEVDAKEARCDRIEP